MVTLVMASDAILYAPSYLYALFPAVSTASKCRYHVPSSVLVILKLFDCFPPQSTTVQPDVGFAVDVLHAYLT